MGLPQRVFYSVNEVAVRWECSLADIAGVLSENRRVLGMMPHPERAVDAGHGGTDGKPLFAGLIGQMTAA